MLDEAQGQTSLERQKDTLDETRTSGSTELGKEGSVMWSSWVMTACLCVRAGPIGQGLPKEQGLKDSYPHSRRRELSKERLTDDQGR